MDRYCVDINVFIEAKNGPYGFDIVPAFWSWIDAKVTAGLLYSTVTVYQELAAGNDELASWAKDRRHTDLFVPATEETQLHFRSIATYVMNQYETAHAETFLGGADPWVIAQSITDQSVLVTREATVNAFSKKVKIPNICQ